MKTTFTGRQFQFWQYRVSHGELLVRSPKDTANPRNIDITFAGVEYLELPRFLPDLEIDEALEEDFLRAKERLGRPLERANVVVLKSLGRRYIVVAAAVKATESEMDIFESPFQ